MNRGAIISAVVATVAMSGVVVAFLTNSSPYVTVAQAKTMQADRLHLAGDLVRNSIRQDFAKRTTTFDLRDETGEVMTVVYTGQPPTNMAEATKVVAIGGVKDGKFQSNQLLVKCPSKYESEKKS